jgi:hypothetical protein
MKVNYPINLQAVVYNLFSWKGMDTSFQGQKTEHFYLVRVKFYQHGGY